MMSSAGRRSRLAWRWPSQRPATIAVAMRMPYQRRTTGPIWNAIAPGELITVLRITRREGRLVVGAAGLEPARPRGQRLLRASRLPVPPRPPALPSEAPVFRVGLLHPSLLVF